jgi:hypothetical protein
LSAPFIFVHKTNRAKSQSGLGNNPALPGNCGIKKERSRLKLVPAPRITKPHSLAAIERKGVRRDGVARPWAGRVDGV